MSTCYLSLGLGAVVFGFGGGGFGFVGVITFRSIFFGGLGVVDPPPDGAGGVGVGGTMTGVPHCPLDSAVCPRGQHDGGAVWKFGVSPARQQMLPVVQEVAVVTQSPFCSNDPGGQQPPGCEQATVGLAGNGEQYCVVPAGQTGVGAAPASQRPSCIC